MVDFKKLTKKEEPRVYIDGEIINIEGIPDKSISSDIYEGITANSEGFRLLYPKLNDEVLEYVVKKCLENCGNFSPVTYNYALQEYLVPELLKRLKEND